MSALALVPKLDDGGEGRPVTDLPFHALADVFPLLDGAELEALTGDIRSHGLREPIVIHEGRILDGRNRYRACQAAGVEPRLMQFEGADPVAYVVSINLRRRHLTESQRAMAAAKLANTRWGGSRRDDQEANLPLEEQPRRISASSAADLLNVSNRSVRAARAVQEHAIPAVTAAVERGEASIATAEVISKLPEPEQQTIVEKARAAALNAAERAVKGAKASGEPITRRGVRAAMRGAVKEVREAYGISAPQPASKKEPKDYTWIEWVSAVEHLAENDPDLDALARDTPVLHAEQLDAARRALPKLKAWIKALEAAR